jgi:hypothetical protein
VIRLDGSQVPATVTIIAICLRASRDISYIFSGRRQSGRDTTLTPATSMAHHRSASFLALVPTKSVTAMASKLKHSETEPMIVRPIGHSVAGKHRDNIPLAMVPQPRQQALSVSQAYGMLSVHRNLTYCVGSSGKARDSESYRGLVLSYCNAYYYEIGRIQGYYI